MTLRVSLDSPLATDVERVGGKAASLARLRAAELPVPEGHALTVDFFAPWFAVLVQHPAWSELAAHDTRRAACEALQVAARALEPDEDQQAALAVGEGLWAVRSSSPEEDLAGASFAGGYHTELGVTRVTVLDAVRACFASSLDFRVLTYKEQHGFDPLTPQIAVVVQRQLDSDVAGVAFSVNPETNDYDECAIDAAPGLGESVVSGAVTPDHFLVDKVTGALLKARRGQQDHALRLDRDGGVQRVVLSSDDVCLSGLQVTEVAALCGQVERLFDMPVDIEWAVADGTLWLLQARPITAWVPLPPRVRTVAGERRRLYQDLGLSGGLTINAPISPLGESWMARFAGLAVRAFLGDLPWKLGSTDTLWLLEGGRMYQDLSNVLWMSTPGLLGRSQRSMDPLVAEILGAIDGKRYRAPKRPRWLSPWLLFLYPRAVWRARALLSRALQSVFWPEKARATFDADVAAFRAEMVALPEVSFDELVEANGERVIRHVLEVTMPGLLVAMGGMALTERLLPARLVHHAEALTRGFEGNDVVEMGLALHAFGPLLEDLTPDQASSRLADGTASSRLQEAWHAFVARYGWRGPHEMDLASPRYADDPALALRQVSRTTNGFDPRVAASQAREKRIAAWETVQGEVGWFRRQLLTLASRWSRAFAGTRDMPKHDYLMFFAALRRSLLAEGAVLVDAGRLDDATQVFGLRLDDILAARTDPRLDLPELAAANQVFVDLLKRSVRAFPAVIDSRGRILRPPPRVEAPGELRGFPVSSGVVQGKVRVLHRPEDGPLLPGEILVAHTTDPGWTPLFVDAGAVVIEVGGVLQHGAVVAREYGKPCVAGIVNAIGRLKDGEWVEVDGTRGVVRRLPAPHV